MDMVSTELNVMFIEEYDSQGNYKMVYKSAKMNLYTMSLLLNPPMW